MRYSTYSVNNETFYGAATEEGMIALSPEFPQWPTLLDVVQANALDKLESVAAGGAVTHTEFQYEMVLPNLHQALPVISAIWSAPRKTIPSIMKARLLL